MQARPARGELAAAEQLERASCASRAAKTQKKVVMHSVGTMLLVSVVLSQLIDLSSRTGHDLTRPPLWLPKTDVLSERIKTMQAESDALFARVNDLNTRPATATAATSSQTDAAPYDGNVLPWLPSNLTQGCKGGSSGSGGGGAPVASAADTAGSSAATDTSVVCLQCGVQSEA